MKMFQIFSNMFPVQRKKTKEEIKKELVSRHKLNLSTSLVGF